MKTQRLNLDSEVFEEFRERMNIALDVAFRNMIAKNLREGNITGKIKIKLIPASDENGEMIYMPVIEPGVSVGLKAKADLECEKMTGFYMKEGRDGGFIVGSRQVSMDELMDEEAEDNEREGPENT